MKKIIRLLVALCFTAHVSASIGSDVYDDLPIQISELTPHLAVGSIDFIDEKNKLVNIVTMKGHMDVTAVVQYGWFEDGESFEGRPMVELYLSERERVKLPRLNRFHPGHYRAIMVNNGDDLVRQIFQPAEIKRIKQKKVLLLKREVSLRLSNVSFGDNCGVYYTVDAVVARKKMSGQMVASIEGMNVHC